MEKNFKIHKKLTDAENENLETEDSDFHGLAEILEARYSSYNETYERVLQGKIYDVLYAYEKCFNANIISIDTKGVETSQNNVSSLIDNLQEKYKNDKTITAAAKTIKTDMLNTFSEINTQIKSLDTVISEVNDYGRQFFGPQDLSRRYENKYLFVCTVESAHFKSLEDRKETLNTREIGKLEQYVTQLEKKVEELIKTLQDPSKLDQPTFPCITMDKIEIATQDAMSLIPYFHGIEYKVGDDMTLYVKRVPNVQQEDKPYEMLKGDKATFQYIAALNYRKQSMELEKIYLIVAGKTKPFASIMYNHKEFQKTILYRKLEEISTSRKINAQLETIQTQLEKKRTQLQTLRDRYKNVNIKLYQEEIDEKKQFGTSEGIEPLENLLNFYTSLHTSLSTLLTGTFNGVLTQLTNYGKENLPNFLIKFDNMTKYLNENDAIIDEAGGILNVQVKTFEMNNTDTIVRKIMTTKAISVPVPFEVLFKDVKINDDESVFVFRSFLLFRGYPYTLRQCISKHNRQEYDLNSIGSEGITMKIKDFEFYVLEQTINENKNMIGLTSYFAKQNFRDEILFINIMKQGVIQSSFMEDIEEEGKQFIHPQILRTEGQKVDFDVARKECNLLDNKTTSKLSISQIVMGLSLFGQNNGRLLLSAPPGFGKSNIYYYALRGLYQMYSETKYTILVICDPANIKTQYNNLFLSPSWLDMTLSRYKDKKDGDLLKPGPFSERIRLISSDAGIPASKDDNKIVGDREETNDPEKIKIKNWVQEFDRLFSLSKIDCVNFFLKDIMIPIRKASKNFADYETKLKQTFEETFNKYTQLTLNKLYDNKKKLSLENLRAMIGGMQVFKGWISRKINIPSQTGLPTILLAFYALCLALHENAPVSVSDFGEHKAMMYLVDEVYNGAKANHMIFVSQVFDKENSNKLLALMRQEFNFTPDMSKDSQKDAIQNSLSQKRKYERDLRITDTKVKGMIESAFNILFISYNSQLLQEKSELIKHIKDTKGKDMSIFLDEVDKTQENKPFWDGLLKDPNMFDKVFGLSATIGTNINDMMNLTQYFKKGSDESTEDFKLAFSGDGASFEKIGLSTHNICTLDVQPNLKAQLKMPKRLEGLEYFSECARTEPVSCFNVEKDDNYIRDKKENAFEDFVFSGVKKVKEIVEKYASTVQEDCKDKDNIICLIFTSTDDLANLMYEKMVTRTNTTETFSELTQTIANNTQNQPQASYNNTHRNYYISGTEKGNEFSSNDHNNTGFSTIQTFIKHCQEACFEKKQKQTFYIFLPKEYARGNDFDNCQFVFKINDYRHKVSAITSNESIQIDGRIERRNSHENMCKKECSGIIQLWLHPQNQDIEDLILVIQETAMYKVAVQHFSYVNPASAVIYHYLKDYSKVEKYKRLAIENNKSLEEKANTLLRDNDEEDGDDVFEDAVDMQINRNETNLQNIHLNSEQSDILKSLLSFMSA